MSADKRGVAFGGRAQRKSWQLLALFLGLSLIAAACGGGDDDDEGAGDKPSSTFKQGGDFVELGTFVGDPPEHIDPGLNQTLDAYQVVNALYDGLTDIDASDPDNPVIRPQVAESYEANDDATVWTFKVRKGLQFSNGEKVLPSSFARAWERASDPDFAGVYSYLMTFIKGGAEKLDGKADTLEGVEADDDAMTLTVTLAAPYSNFDAVAGFQLFFPMPKAVEELDDQTQRDNGMMVGNGPFMLDKPRSDTEIVLVRNPKCDGTKYDKGFKLPKKPYLGIPGFKEGLCEFCAYDKEAAQDAYDEWKADGNELKDPIKIQFNIDAGHEDVVDLIIDDWKAIGIPAERQGIDTETYFTQLSDGACTVCRAGWFADYPTYDNFMFDLWGSESSNNYSYMADKKFDGLVADAKKTVDKDDQAKLFQDAEQVLLNDDVAVIPLVWYRGDYVYDPETVDNFQATNFGLIIWEQVALK